MYHCTLQYSYCKPRHYLSVRLVHCFVFFLFLFSPLLSSAQQENNKEEITVMLNVPRVGSTDISAYISGQDIYLSITEVFEFLKIKNKFTPESDLVDGYFLDPEARYSISKEKNQIFFQNRIFHVQPDDLMKTDVGLYLKCNYFGTFGLDCAFDFRSLSVNLQARIELPVIREMQQELTRRNIGRLRGERKADTTIDQRFPLFRLGMADWNATYNSGATGKDFRLNLALGGMILGGETNVNLNHVAGKPLDKKTQLYRWRHVNNNRAWMRQVSLGKIFTDATSTLIAPVVGIQINNTPTTYRRSFGTYILSNKTEPGWMVELYVNNILINYTRADASGFFTFEVPMVYGASNVKLRFYGPWGEEHTREEHINIPINFLPANQFEYNVTAGVVSDSANTRFARASFKYGLDRTLTIGGGYEYNNAVASGQNMPYLNGTMRLLSNVILHGEYTYGVRSKGVLSYRHPSSLQIDVNYVKYIEGQTAVKFMEEKRAVLSMPIRTKKYTGFTRLTLTQFNDMKKEPGTSAELLLSSFFSGVSSNLTTYAILTEPKNPLIWSNLSMTVRLPNRLRLTQQTHYDYRKQNVTMLRTEIEKTVFKNAFINLVYEKNLTAKTNSFGFGIRFNLSFTQTSMFASKTNESMMFTQSARGSLLYDDNNHKLSAFNQSNVTRAGLTIVPFLDINNNGVKDEGEPKVCGLKLRVSGGRLTHCSKDTTIQIAGLEPFANYLLEIDRNSFDNIAWQVKQPTVNVVTEPNYFKRIDVPVSIVGEVDGKVLMEGVNGRNGQGRILVRFLKNGKQVAKVMTEPDGYFNYIGLVPGKYIAEVDGTQLENLQMAAAPAKIAFIIKSNLEGDFVEGLEFVLRKKTNP